MQWWLLAAEEDREVEGVNEDAVSDWKAGSLEMGGTNL